MSWSALKDQGVKLLFLATPHEASRSLVPEAVANGLRVIDLSGAWRIKNAAYRAVYGFKDEGSATAAEYTDKAVYGLPELNRDQIADATVVANPGCYATTVILALAPLLKADLVDKTKGLFPTRNPASPARAKSPRRAPTSFPSPTIFRPTRFSVIATWEKSSNSCISTMAS